MPLNTKQVKHIAKLARLYVSDDEIEDYKLKLDSILEYIDKLQEIETKDVSELQHALDVTNVFREDVEEGCEQDKRKIALDNFAHRDGDFLEVQAIFERE